MRYLIVLVLVVGAIASTQAASHIACRIECSPADPCPNHQYCQTVGCATHCLPYIGKRFFLDDLDSKCPVVGCLMFCPYGQAKDKAGCTVCACAEAPKLKPETKVAMSEESAVNKRFLEALSCPFVGCLMLCPYGQTKDKAGCPLCACAEAPKLKPETKVAMSEETAVSKRFLTDCPNFLGCNIYCYWGQAVDDKGCTLCACTQGPPVKKRSLSDSRVALTSETGIVLTETKVEKRMCPIFCQWGMAKDEHGTTLACQCAPPPTDVGKRFLQACPPVCAIACFWGQAVDDKGCPLCACAHKPPVKKRFVPDPRVALTPETGIALTETKVEKRACLIFCQWGLAKDENGHFLNCGNCALPPTDVGKRFLQVCPPDGCHILCIWGRATDDKGCPLCACAHKPVHD